MRRRFLVAFLLTSGAALAMMLFPIGQADALPEVETWTFYYSDAAMTQNVGTRFVGCSGQGNMEGVVGAYSRRLSGMSCNPGLPETMCYICWNSNSGERVDCPLGEAQFFGFPECN